MLLVKFPTRSRPELFLKTLSDYVRMAKDNSRIQYLVSIDEDDTTMSPEVIEKALSLHENVVFYTGKGVSKIEACNRDIEKAKPWQICLLISDDMKVGALNWDQRIIDDFNGNYDQCVWYFDGYQKSICTLSCVGKQYYDRFNYLYHPSYKSFFCDNEFTEVAQQQGKIKFIGIPIIKHQHPSWGGAVANDELYQRNDVFWAHDEENYYKRKANGFN